MIKNNNVKESERIAKSLKFKLQKGYNALSFIQDGETKIALLDVKEASNSIVQRLSKNPDQAHNLRWIRDTERNKQILGGYLMRRIIVSILGSKEVFYYMPCCNSFSYHKPKEGQGHKQVNSDCLLLLLGEQERYEVRAFKKQQRQQNKSISWKEFLKLLRPKLTSYLKKKSPLEWVGHFIEGLPQKDGCFQLPLIKCKPFETCPGSCPLLSVGKPLEFKVDLTTKNPEFDFQAAPHSPSHSQPRRTHSRYTKSSKKKQSSNKRLKTQFLSSKKKQSLSNDQTSKISYDLPPPIFIESQEPSEHLEATREASTHHISSFDCQISAGTADNFKHWSESTANFSGSLFKKESSPGERDPREQKMGEKLHLSELERLFPGLDLTPSQKEFARTLDDPEMGFSNQNSIMAKKDDETVSEAGQSIIEAQKGQGVINELIDLKLKIQAKKQRMRKKVTKIDEKKDKLLKGITQLEKDEEGIDKAILEMVIEDHQRKLKREEKSSESSDSD